MKALWLKWSARIDAMSLRERIFVFAAAVASLVFVADHFALAPLAAQQKELIAAATAHQHSLTALAHDIEEKVRIAQIDPDVATRERLAVLERDIAARSEALRTVQRGLVAPNRIAPLLEAMLRSNGKLRLVSLRTLPVTGLSEASVEASAEPPAPAHPAELDSAAVTAAALKNVQPAAPAMPDLNKLSGGLVPAVAQPGAAAAAPAAAANPPKPPELMYRHGVEVTLQGNYVDMVNYLAALEALPTQVFWGEAKLDAHDFEATRLTLTIYTLNLDQKWMQL